MCSIAQTTFKDINHTYRQAHIAMYLTYEFKYATYIFKHKPLIATHQTSIRRTLYILFLLCTLLVSISVSAQVDAKELDCPTLKHGYGPFDYRTATPEQKHLVEGAHFFPNVEYLRKGTSHPSRRYTVVPGGEIDYTLRAFPNHPRALLAMSRWSIQEKLDPPPGAKATVDCYFQSAISFRPDDSMVRVIYGIHLTEKKQLDKALAQFQKAKELGAESSSMYYNLGLAYFGIKRYPEALEAAHKAYALGFPLPGLRNLMEREGVWQDPVKPTTQDKAQDSALPPIIAEDAAERVSSEQQPQ
jgi:hypothetical protein